MNLRIDEERGNQLFTFMNLTSPLLLTARGDLERIKSRQIKLKGENIF